MFLLSGFADEIDQELERQLETLQELGIRFLELRGVWGKNVLDLDEEEVETVRRRLEAAGIAVSAVGSPIGKVGVDDPFTPHLERFRRALEIAQELGTSFIRVFSYFIPEGEDPAACRDEVLSRMETKLRLAEEAGITLLHENEKGIYGEQPERCLDLLQTLGGEHFKAVFDPANFIQAGRDPYEECWPLLKDHVAYFHIKDAAKDTGRVLPAGEGDGRIGDILEEAAASGFRGFLSLEPHLKAAGPFDGFSGPELFGTAVKALRKVLEDHGLREE